MNTQKSNSKSYIEIIFGIVLLGTGPMFVKSVNANGILVAFYRLLFAAVMLAIPALLSVKKSGAPAVKGKSSLWLVAGGIAFAANISLWCSALNYATAAVVTLLDNTAPIWVGIFAWLVLRKRQAWSYWLGLLLAVAGGALLVMGRLDNAASRDPIGIWLSIVSGLTYAVYILVTRQARKFHSSIFYSWMVSLVGMLALLVVALLTGAFQEVLLPQSYLLIFLMALSSQVLGWFLVNDALGKLPSTAASVALVGQPIVSTVLGFFILGEVLTGGQILGAVICLVGILLVQHTVAAE